MGEPAAMWRVGDVVDGRYEVLRVHGHGGMGVVYRVRHRAWGIDLAVKSPRPELFRDAAQRDAFVAEAEAWVSLGLHPHVCGCYYVRVLDGVPRVFAEYVHGGSLRDWIDDRRLYRGPENVVVHRILDIAIQTAWGLDHAHHRGLVHRDVKPGNVLLDPDGDDAVTARITDFGLARIRAVAAAPSPGAAPDASVLVPGGGGMTVAYASPEQAARQRLGRRTDVYSLAVSILEMFTGGVTWLAGPAARYALAAHRVAGPPEQAPPLPVMPPDLADLLARCLAEAPDERPASMAEVAAGLAAVYRRLTGRAHPRPAPAAADLRGDELNNHALSLLDLDRPDEADKAFAQALAADPQHLQATYNSGLTRWRRGAITDEDLVAHLDRVRFSTGDPWPARHLLAQVHLERGDLVAAGALLSDEAADAAEVRAALRSGRVADAREVGSTAMPWQSTTMELWKIARSTSRSAVPPNPVHVAAGARLALTGSHDTRVRLWDLRTGECRRTLDGHGGLVLAVGVTPDGRVGVSAGEDDTVRVWDLTTGECRRVLDPPPPRSGRYFDCTVRASADGRFVLWAGDGTVVLWDLRRDRRTVLHDGRFGAAIDLSPDGRLALFADMRRVRLWDPATLRGWHTDDHPQPQLSASACIGADRRTAVTGMAHGGTILLWDLESGRRLRTLTGHTDKAHALSMSPDARYLLSGAKDATVRLWDLRSGCCLRTFRGPERWVAVSAVVLDDDARAGVSVNSDNTIRRWRMPGGHRAAPQPSRPRPHGELARLRTQVEAQIAEAERAVADGRFPAALDLLTRVRSTPGHERAPRVLDAWWTLARRSARTGLRAAWPVRSLPTGAAYAADLSRDGRLAATSRSDGTVRVWDAGTGACLRVLDADPHKGGRRSADGPRPARSVSLSDDGRRLLAGCGDHAVRLWDVTTGECLRVLTGNERTAQSARFAPGGDRAVVGLWGGAVQLWDLGTGALLWTVDGHPEGRDGSSPGASDVWGSLDGGLVASVGHDGALRFAEAHDGAPVRVVAAHRGVVTSMALSADGRLALTSGGFGDGAIRLWDVATGTRVRQFEDSRRHEPNTVRFTTDGRFAVSSGWDATVRVWDVGTGACLRVPQGHRKGVGGVALTADARYLLSWYLGDATAQLWELDWDLAAPAPGGAR